MFLQPVINHATTKPRGVPKSAKYSHTVFGVSTSGFALVHTNGRLHFNSAPVPVYKKGRRVVHHG